MGFLMFFLVLTIFLALLIVLINAFEIYLRRSSYNIRPNLGIKKTKDFL